MWDSRSETQDTKLLLQRRRWRREYEQGDDKGGKGGVLGMVLEVGRRGKWEGKIMKMER